MKMFELNGRKRKSGRRPFTAILHEIYPDTCIDGKTGTQFNENGICWIREYCEQNLDTIKGMSFTVEYADPDAQNELLGHGDTGFDSGIPVFDNATIVGNFEKGYIADVEINGVMKTVVIGEGTIDQMRNNNFVKFLEEKCANGEEPFGSVEICRCEGHDKIEYLNGKFEEGRIPVVFDYSGYSLLGVRPADATARLVELNEKTESEVNAEMDEMKTLIQSVLDKIDESAISANELNQAKDAYAELETKYNELNASSQQIQAALDQAKAELEGWDAKWNELYNEKCALEKLLAEARVKERLGELNNALAVFTDEQIAFAKDEKDAFESDPLNCEINTVVNKIYCEIGKRAEEKRIAEQNAAHEEHNEPEAEDIFSEINTPDSDEDGDIF